MGIFSVPFSVIDNKFAFTVAQASKTIIKILQQVDREHRRQD
jgi:hypothetical protein